MPPESPERLAEAILQLRDDPMVREAMGQRGRAYALKYHSPDAAAEGFDKLWNQRFIENGQQVICQK